LNVMFLKRTYYSWLCPEALHPRMVYRLPLQTRGTVSLHIGEVQL
jgi:hypothetical protein